MNYAINMIVWTDLIHVRPLHDVINFIIQKKTELICKN